jgi:hypothetical protein
LFPFFFPAFASVFGCKYNTPSSFSRGMRNEEPCSFLV